MEEVMMEIIGEIEVLLHQEGDLRTMIEIREANLKDPINRKDPGMIGAIGVHSHTEIIKMIQRMIKIRILPRISHLMLDRTEVPVEVDQVGRQNR